MKHDRLAVRTVQGAALLAADLALIAEAIADAFRAMLPSRLESRWSQLRFCGCSF